MKVQQRNMVQMNNINYSNGSQSDRNVWMQVQMNLEMQVLRPMNDGLDDD